MFQDKFGLKAAIGSIRDYAFVEKIAQDAHIVIQTVDDPFTTAYHEH